MNTCRTHHSRCTTSNGSLAIFEPVHDTNWSLIGLKLSLSLRELGECEVRLLLVHIRFTTIGSDNDKNGEIVSRIS